jgi:Family of unknown function (DUF5829)
MSPLTVLLNHFYLTLDATTYTAIAESAFLRTQFTSNETRTTHRTDRSYTGLYFYGEKTYFEFFDVTTETNRSIGDSAIAFGLEKKGATGRLQQQWPNATRLTITRPFEETQIKWFEMLIPSGFSLESPIAVWSMEYLPSFLQEWKNPSGGSSKSESTISRSAVLDRYKALISTIAKPILKNVIGITLWAESSVYEAFIQFAKDFGFSTTITKDGFSFIDADGVKYQILLTNGDLHGITEVEFEVNDIPAQRKWQFGNSILTFSEEKTAVWQFKG